MHETGHHLLFSTYNCFFSVGDRIELSLISGFCSSTCEKGSELLDREIRESCSMHTGS